MSIFPLCLQRAQIAIGKTGRVGQLPSNCTRRCGGTLWRHAVGACYAGARHWKIVRLGLFKPDSNHGILRCPYV